MFQNLFLVDFFYLIRIMALLNLEYNVVFIIKKKYIFWDLKIHILSRLHNKFDSYTKGLIFKTFNFLQIWQLEHAYMK
jgi:hypothetical protein